MNQLMISDNLLTQNSDVLLPRLIMVVNIQEQEDEIF